MFLLTALNSRTGDEYHCMAHVKNAIEKTQLIPPKFPKWMDKTVNISNCLYLKILYCPNHNHAAIFGDFIHVWYVKKQRGRTHRNVQMLAELHPHLATHSDVEEWNEMKVWLLAS